MNTRSMFFSEDDDYNLRRNLGVARLVCAFAILMVLLPTDSSNAGLNQWTTNGPDDAGPILSLAVDPNIPAIVYAGTGHAGTLSAPCSKAPTGVATGLLRIPVSGTSSSALWSSILRRHPRFTPVPVVPLSVPSLGECLRASTAG